MTSPISFVHTLHVLVILTVVACAQGNKIAAPQANPTNPTPKFDVSTNSSLKFADGSVIKDVASFRSSSTEAAQAARLFDSSAFEDTIKGRETEIRKGNIQASYGQPGTPLSDSYTTALKNLSSGDLRSLLYYTLNGSSVLASAIWGDLPRLRIYKMAVLCTISAINQLPPNPGTSYHGRRSDIAEFQTRWKVGQIFTAPNFISSSMDPQVSIAFTNPPFNPDYKLRTLVKIDGKSGRDISPVSIFKTEKEVLFLPRVQFKIISVEKVEDKTLEKEPVVYKVHVKEI